MGELGIILALVLGSWVYAALHEVNKETRDWGLTQVITIGLTLGAIAAGVAEVIR